ncbi:ComEA family DNA-binding protein [Microbispora sp. H11081]|uniref:ComEA family DNA-binding protein n=1 Tax=Microbispora sp. H11081 TaxID=2729107 RepID=UPI001B8C8308|nr:ComEA family DNA-binding protein [Microbispora sp. H11081]
MRSKESRGAARGVVVGESRLRGLLRPFDPVPPSVRLRSTPAPPGPPPSFGAPHVVRTEPYVPDHPQEAAGPRRWEPQGPAEEFTGEWDGRADAPHREGAPVMPEVFTEEYEDRAGEPEASARDLRTLGRAALERAALGRAALGRASVGRALPRLDPGMPGVRLLSAAGVLAVIVTGILVWRSRPVAEPIAPPVPAAAVRDLPMTAATAATADPDAVARAVPGAGPGAGATAYVAGAGTAAAATPGSPARVVVYVTGKVRDPGVYVLVAGSRVADAIEAAGGLRKGAKPGGVNLARRLTDGEQIVAGSPATAGPGSSSGATPGTPGAGVVSLNTATAEQFDALPGIGAVLAQRIVDYRDAHGGFQSVDQLKEVPGIGDSKFAEMRDKVTL